MLVIDAQLDACHRKTLFREHTDGRTAASGELIPGVKHGPRTHGLVTHAWRTPSVEPSVRSGSSNATGCLRGSLAKAGPSAASSAGALGARLF
jgi:hypothetical protein